MDSNLCEKLAFLSLSDWISEDAHHVYFKYDFLVTVISVMVIGSMRTTGLLRPGNWKRIFWLIILIGIFSIKQWSIVKRRRKWRSDMLL